MLAVEELDPPASQAIVPVVDCTVLLSVFAHGFTFACLAQRHGGTSDRTGAPQDGPAVDELAQPGD
ncbi:hypothetical protein ACFTXM_05690 [Streptomyces sp. NPDC056930]|uniref:hypothetical protein n=1 Tax=Streptomyces sp. NPDC056930 TaxID=3345967 RepID=UPI0036410073